MDDPTRMPGTPVPEVDPGDVKAVWELYRDVEARHPGQQVAVGAGLMALHCSKGADLHAVGYRAAFLSMMVTHAPEIASWVKGGQPHEALFRAIAQTRMEWMQPGVERKGPPFSMEEFMSRLSAARE